jgi:hypothetical protein
VSERCNDDLDFGEHWFICHLPNDGHIKHVHDMHDPEIVGGIHYTVTWERAPRAER